jgi:hexosaminidase
MRLSLSLLFAAAELLGQTNALWPQPAKITNGTSVVWISPNVKTVYKPSYTSGGGRDDDKLIQGALERFKTTLAKSAYVPWKFYPKFTDFEPSQGAGSASVKLVTVERVPSSGKPTKPNSSKAVDESYTLKLAKDGTTVIRAATAQGAMHGLTTLAQLFYATSKGGDLYTNMAPVDISDKPTYPHRGVNIDISRNFEPPQQVKRIIDGMAFSKLNRLHIHATDSQAWPLEIPSIPELAKQGAYSNATIWSAADLKDVQEYARQRGVQSIVEIDSPGHTATIWWSHPELIAAYNYQPWATHCNQPPCGQVKLNSPAVDKFFTRIYRDLLPRVKQYGEYFHSGGDELNANVYALDETVNSNNPQVIRPFLQRFKSHLHKLIREEGLKHLVWEEMILNWNLTLPKDNTLIQTWQPGSLPQVLKKGYRALFGDYTFWYLDCGNGQWVDPDLNNPDTPIVPPYADYCSPLKSWRQIYAYDPRINVTAEEQKLIEGGEVHLWHELTDPINLDQKLWPRASTAGEVMWTGPKGVPGVEESVTRRLADMRERLVGLGFGASVVQVTWCLQNVGQCSL